jgi:hypothetical protein
MVDKPMFRKTQHPENPVPTPKAVHRKPLLAFFYCLILGLFVVVFGILESMSGFSSNPVRNDFAVGGLMEAIIPGGAFLLVAGMLWVHPTIGAILMILMGVGLSFVFGWTPKMMEPFLVYAPIILGIFSLFTRSHSRRHDKINPRAAK